MLILVGTLCALHIAQQRVVVWLDKENEKLLARLREAKK